MLYAAGSLPRPDHVVIVVEEDHSYDQILGAPSVPPILWTVQLPPPSLNALYIHSLAANGASFTNARSVGNTNAVDYNAIFSGLSTSKADRPWLHPYTAPNLASELIAAGLTFGGYSESLPHAGYAGADVGSYKRAHNPWVDFANVPPEDNLPFSQLPTDYNQLPTVSFVVPNEQNNMHSSTVQAGDQWLQDHISGYAHWAMSHNSMLIVTWDESHSGNNSIPTIFFGPMVQSGKYAEPISQLNVLRTVEEMYGLAPTGHAADVSLITDTFSLDGVDTATRRAAARYNAQLRRQHRRERGSISGAVKSGVTASHAHKRRPPAGWFVYLDVNGDGQFGPDEPSARTDDEGRFSFQHVPAGSYLVRVVPQSGYALQAPSAGAYTVNLGQHGHAHGLLFSEQQIP